MRFSRNMESVFYFLNSGRLCIERLRLVDILVVLVDSVCHSPDSQKKFLGKIFVEFNLTEFGKTVWWLVIFTLPLQFDVGPSFQKTLIRALMSGTISVKLWIELNWFGNQTHTKLGV